MHERTASGKIHHQRSGTISLTVEEADVASWGETVIAAVDSDRPLWLVVYGSVARPFALLCSQLNYAIVAAVERERWRLTHMTAERPWAMKAFQPYDLHLSAHVLRTTYHRLSIADYTKRDVIRTVQPVSPFVVTLDLSRVDASDRLAAMRTLNSIERQVYLTTAQQQELDNYEQAIALCLPAGIRQAAFSRRTVKAVESYCKAFSQP